MMDFFNLSNSQIAKELQIVVDKYYYHTIHHSSHKSNNFLKILLNILVVLLTIIINLIQQLILHLLIVQNIWIVLMNLLKDFSHFLMKLIAIFIIDIQIYMLRWWNLILALMFLNLLEVFSLLPLILILFPSFIGT